MFGVRKACRELAEWCHETQQENDRLKAENEKLRKLSSKLGILADSGLMALDDKEFASIIDSAKELGVEW